MARNVAFDILARDKASRTFDNISKAADKTDKKIGMIGARSKHVSAGIRVGFGAAATALGVVGGGALLKGFIDEAREAGKVTRITANAIRVTGGTAGVTADHVSQLAESLAAKTAIDDEVIQTGSNLLLTFKQVRNEAGKGNDVFDRATAAAADLSIQFGSVDSAAKMMGKALNDPVKGMTALGRAGVTFTAQQQQQIKVLAESGQILQAQKIILQEVESQVGGAAAAAADPVQRLGIAWQNLQESVGVAALPVLEGAANWMTNTGIPAVADFTHFVGQMGDEFADLPQWVQIATGAITGVTLTVPLAVSGFKKIGEAVDKVKTKYKQMSRFGQLSSLALGGVGLALAAGSVVLGIFADDHIEAEQRVEDFTEAIKADSGAVGENTREKIQNGIIEQDLASKADAAGVSISTVARAIAGQSGAMSELTDKQRALKAELDPIAGKYGSLTESQRQRVKTLHGEVLAIDELIGGTRMLSGEVGKARENYKLSKEVEGQVTKGLQGNTGAVNENAGALDALGGELQTVVDLQRDAAGVVIDESEARIRYQESIDSAREALENNNATLDTSTKKGRENRQALNGMARAALDQAKAMEENGASQQSVRSHVESARRKFVKMAEDMGMSGKEARRLGKKLFQLKDDANSALGGIDDEPVKVKLGLSGLTDINATFEKLKGLRAGGPVYGPGSGTSDTAGVFALSNNEHVWTADETAGAGGHSAVMRLRKMAKAGELRGMRSGGPVLRGQVPSTGQLSAYMSAYASETAQIGNALGALMAKKFNALETSGGSAGLLGWANAHEGRPYVWGAAGPGGFDCSGWVSALTNKARGSRSPYSRLGSTATFPWAGFLPGPGRVLSVGSTKNAGGGIGHMAASIGRIPTESAGAVGVMVGGGARGAGSGLFGGNIWHPRGLREGGPIDKRRGDPPFEGRVVKADTGAVLPPKSVTAVVNDLPTSETVLPNTPKQIGEAMADALLRKLERRGKTLEIVDNARRADVLARGR